jgi:hypothetical protein
MKNWTTYDEPVRVTSLRHSFFPDLFCWRGRCYEVQSVVHCWTTSRKRRGQRIGRRYFRLLCADTTFDLFQDLEHGTWHLRRALPLPAPAPVTRRAQFAWR